MLLICASLTSHTDLVQLHETARMKRQSTMAAANAPNVTMRRLLPTTQSVPVESRNTLSHVWYFIIAIQR